MLRRTLRIAVTLALFVATAHASDDAAQLDSALVDAAQPEVVDAAAPKLDVIGKPLAKPEPPKLDQAKPDPKEFSQPQPLANASIALGERKLCTIRVGRGTMSAEERARRASHALEQALDDGRAHDIGVSFEGNTAIVRIGDAPIVQLGPEDAAAANDASVSVHAESCAASMREGLRTELRRRQIANLVFSASLIVLSGLLAFLMLGAVSRATQRVYALLEARENLPGLKIGTLELMTPAAIRVTAATAIGIAKPLAQLMIVLGWLLSSLSLFPVTQAFGRRITGYVLVPLTTFLGRVGAALPLLVLVGIGAFTLAMLLRFLRVFFDNVAQGGIELSWLSPRQALGASFIARTVAIIGALLVAAPLIGGDASDWGALRIAGVALTATLALALAPTFANIALGVATLFDPRYKADTNIEIASPNPIGGRLAEISLTHLHIVDRSGADVRVSHLSTLLHPLRVLGELLPARYEVVVDARAPQGVIRKALADAVRRQGRAAHVELTEIEGERAVYLVVGMTAPGEEDLASAIADELTRQNVTFARIRKLAVT